MTDKPIGRPFAKGHRNFHDVAAAGRKGKANSPWRRGCNWLGGGGTCDERIEQAMRQARNRRA